MVISFPAFVCLETTWRHFLAYAGRGTRAFPALSAPGTGPGDDGGGAAGDSATERRRERQPAVAETVAADGSAGAAAGGPLTPAERRARAVALHGLTLSRGRRFAAAATAFAEAARLDPALDLTRTPGFWNLERAAHEAAIDAYVAADREGDAAILRARVQSTYRPKPVRSMRGALSHS